MATKGLRNFPPEIRSKIARQRLMCQTKGLGYLGALDYFEKTKGSSGGASSGRTEADRPNDNTGTEP